MDHATLWRHIHTERAALAATLRTLTPQQWAHESLCTGWSVQDVAAHVISNPQIGWRQLPAVLADAARLGYNEAIFRDVRRRGQQPREQIVADFERWATSTRHVPTTTSVETLVDALVHHQDIVRPLGLHHDPDPTAASVAADRCRLLAGLLGSRRVVRGVRMVATDTDWARGSGPVVEAAMVELLMLCAGRPADPARLTGEASDALRALV